jgi:hypothetical protein
MSPINIIDLGTMSAFVKRWHEETPSFDLPIKKMTLRWMTCHVDVWEWFRHNQIGATSTPIDIEPYEVRI